MSVSKEICDFRVRYNLIEINEKIGCSYTVHLLKISKSGNEEAEVVKFTNDLYVAFDFFDKIVRGSVTPISLTDIAEDYLY